MRIPYIRKICVLVLTGAAFVVTASFSVTATRKQVAENKVVLIDDSGDRIVLEKSDVLNVVQEGQGEVETFSADDEAVERILADTRAAAKALNERARAGTEDESIRIFDEKQGYVDADFSEDWSLILINKEHRIPPDYQFELATIKGDVKSDVRVAEHVIEMLQAAKDDGVYIFICSPYRDLEKQEMLFEKKIKSYTRKGYDYDEAYDLASETVAIPGTSEHQVGLAFDFVTQDHQTLDAEFAETDGGIWLKEHAPDYGFILRYPLDKTEITGIEFEPWHYRYVGVRAAREITALGLCLEEYDKLIGNVD
ncbi:MAG: M15 family metallopeptidase [Lachnospiraceae bacterium]|nr:M15 family metallopeptidase [Lachnospiraceae bacterium]